MPLPIFTLLEKAFIFRMHFRGNTMNIKSSPIANSFLLILLSITALHINTTNATILGHNVLSSGSCSNVNTQLVGQEMLIEKTMNSIEPCDLDITLFVTSSFVIDNLSITENVLNNTGIDWDDYHLILGSGFGDQFMESDNNDSLHFRRESGMLPTNNDFAQIPLDPTELDPDSLDFFGGTGVENGDTTTFDFAIAGLFDGDADGRITFTLRQIPSISEPSSFALMGLMVGLLMLRRKQ